MASENEIAPKGLMLHVSIIYWFVTALTTIFFSLAGLLIIAPLSLLFTRRTRHWSHLVAVYWAKALLFLSPFWRLTVTGTENIDPKKNYVIVVNHLSLLDIPVCLAALKPSFKFLAKRELLQVPFIGWQMALAGYIPIDRSSRQSGQKASDIARQWLSRGMSVLFYPEGTRSDDGEIKTFKMGPFKIAQKENMEILPVVLNGTRDVIPKKSWRVKAHVRMQVSVGKPVRILGENGEALERGRAVIREEMVDRLAKIRAAKA